MKAVVFEEKGKTRGTGSGECGDFLRKLLLL